MGRNCYENFGIGGAWLVLRTHELYHRTGSGKSWRKNPHKIDKEVFKNQNYEWFIQSIPFFNSRAYWNYTKAGYVPTRVTTVSPDGMEKHVDRFQFINLYDLKENAGWRETEVIENAKTFEIETVGNREVLHLYTNDKGVTSSGSFELMAKRWVG